MKLDMHPVLTKGSNSFDSHLVSKWQLFKNFKFNKTHIYDQIWAKLDIHVVFAKIWP